MRDFIILWYFKNKFWKNKLLFSKIVRKTIKTLVTYLLWIIYDLKCHLSSAWYYSTVCAFSPAAVRAYNSGLRAQQLPMHRTRPSFPYSLHGWSNAKPILRVPFHSPRFTPRRVKSFDDSSSLVSSPLANNSENRICPFRQMFMFQCSSIAFANFLERVYFQQ